MITQADVDAARLALQNAYKASSWSATNGGRAIAKALDLLLAGPVAVPVPSPPPTPAPPTATGQFTVVGSKIIAPNGLPFKPVGVNLLGGPKSWWDRPTLGLAATVKRWGFNIIRLNCSTSASINVNTDLDAIIKEFTDAGIVVMPEFHDFTGRYPTDSELATLCTWWATLATKHANNPYFWINVANEMGGEKPVSNRWLTVHDTVIKAVRKVAPTTIIVCDGAAWGQDAYSWDNTPVVKENSAILTYGPQLVATNTNIMFSIHLYEQWLNADTKLNDYIIRVQSAGLSILFGEVGGYGYYNGQNTDFVPVLKSAVNISKTKGVGVIAWHGQGYLGSDGMSLVNVTGVNLSGANADFSNLTSAGTLMRSLVL